MAAAQNRNLRLGLAVGAIVLAAAGGVALWALQTRAPTQAPSPDPALARPAEKALPPAQPRPAVRARPATGAWVDVKPHVLDAAAPFVIGLHGRGDRAEHFAALAQRLGPRMQWRFLQGPLPFRDGFQWFRIDAADAGAADLQRASDLVRGHLADAGTRKVALVGFSQGCMLAAWFATKYPDAVQAVLCIAGALPAPPEPAPATRRPKLLFVYGGEDTLVAPAAVQESLHKLEELGFPTEQIAHSEGHVVPEPEVERMRGWLEKSLAPP